MSEPEPTLAVRKPPAKAATHIEPYASAGCESAMPPPVVGALVGMADGEQRGARTFR